MSVTAAKGFVAAGVACGIKAGGALDLALVATDGAGPANAAAVFSSNLATAAPVQVSRAHLESSGGRAAAVVVNSGNANAATGGPGRVDAERTCALVAERLSVPDDEVLVCSTGLIGIPLPMGAIEVGIGPLAGSRSRSGGSDAAEAILTTDTVRKEAVVGADGFVVGGMAKGAAMLAPNLATMLAVLTTDARAAPADLQRVLAAAVGPTFNALSVDGCTSTNDTVVLLASGLTADDVPLDDLERAVTRVCADLARQMADDAEGATKVATVRVTGARSVTEARRAVRKVAESQLVQCSLYGGDPYWGRVVSELGSSGAGFDPDLVSVSYGGEVVCRAGVATAHDPRAVRDHLAGRHIELRADLGLGEAEAAVLTTDLSPAYIAENMKTS